MQIYGKFFIPAKLLHKKNKKIIFVPMKRVVNIIVIALFTLIYGEMEAQIKFEKKSHNFGVISEDGGAIECDFRFRNISAEPVVVVAARSSCGCTKAEFSRKPVMPDSLANIKVVFNPLNYPGVFARKVTIVTNQGVLEEQLLVSGEVIPRKKTIEERYPILLGNGVRVATNAHSFGYLEHGKAKQSTFELYNGSSDKVSLRVDNRYSELEFYSPSEIGSGEEITLNFACSLSEDSAKYGTLSYEVYLLLDGVRARFPLIINGFAIDSREENANNGAQMIALSENFIKFGAVKCAHAKRARVIELYNRGTRPLEIRKLELDREGFEARIKGDSTINVGEKREVLIEIEPARLPFGAVVEKLRIVSNDPKMPIATIRVSAIVER